jgi:crotonobetainyl-CoA:carnitine CoA-transferase CaiB-like acyl-CoA transferase
VANPVRFSATPIHYQLAPPQLGEHTKSVLQRELQLGEQELAALFADGVIG